MNWAEGYVMGWLSAIMIALAIMVNQPQSAKQKAIEECQKSLPRDQVCVVHITAVPMGAKK